MPRLRALHIKIKTKLGLTTLLTGLVTLVVLLTSTILLIASFESKKNSLMETTLHLNFFNAHKMGQTMDSLFISMRSSLQSGAETFSAMKEMKSEDIYHNLELMRNSSNYFNSIVLVDETGLVRNVAPQSVGTAGKHVTSGAAKEALKLKAPYLSEPYTTVRTGRLIVFMSQPLFNDADRYGGFIGGTMYLQQNNILNMIFGNNAIDDSGSYYYIVSSDGILLFHPQKERIGQDVSSNSVVQKLLKGESGQAQVTNTQGVPMLAGYANVPANGWGVVVVSPMSQIQEQLIGHLKKTLWYTFIPFVLLLLGVIYVANRLARPFVRLADMVNSFGQEEAVLPEARRYWNREADLLTQAIFLALKDGQKQKEQLTQDAMTDPLTGLMNRRMLELKMKQWIAAGTSFSLVVMDVDKFKFVNDTYGHLAGDEVLKHVAGIIRSSVRPSDVCCRYGGEEFVLLLSHAKADEALTVAERVRTLLERSHIQLGMQVTISQGIAHFPSQAESSEELLYKADKALYLAKNGGRNRTVISEE